MQITVSIEQNVFVGCCMISFPVKLLRTVNEFGADSDFFMEVANDA